MKEYQQWFKKAEEDIYTIELLIKDVDAPVSVICFHLQQAEEKYLKAYLVARNIFFPKTHDLSKLINLCLKFNKIESIAIRLSEFGVSPRYPDSFNDLILSGA
jgi:HEPN domain-containing protein